jgi:hypothetical protein
MVHALKIWRHYLIGTVNAITESIHPRLQEEFTKLNMVLCDPNSPDTLEITPTLIEEIKEAQKQTRAYRRSRRSYH